MGGLGVKFQHFPLTLLVVLTTLTLPCERDVVSFKRCALIICAQSHTSEQTMSPTKYDLLSVICKCREFNTVSVKSYSFLIIRDDVISDVIRPGSNIREDHIDTPYRGTLCSSIVQF